MLRHVKKFHSEAAKRKAEESAELTRLELLHASKVPHLSEDSQTGGAVSTRGVLSKLHMYDFHYNHMMKKLKTFNL